MRLDQTTEYTKKLSKMIRKSNPALGYADIILDYPLTDELGGDRNIDLMIVNPEKGIFLPIEITKVSGRARWKVSSRQAGTLSAQFGMLVQITAEQLENDPESVVVQINTLLQMQYSGLVAEQARESQRNTASLGTVRNAITNKVVMTSDVEQLKKEIYERTPQDGLLRRFARKIGL